MYLLPQPEIITEAQGTCDSSVIPARKLNSRMGEQEYSLTISSGEIVFEASSEVGFFYAEKTLEQIKEQSGVQIPCMRIEDKPFINKRGLSFDTTRGRVPSLDELKRTVDMMSRFKMNLLQLYVEHSFAFECEEDIWGSSTPLTAEDIKELDKYCREHHVELVPSLASFGHLYDFLRSKKYRHLCEYEYYEPYSLIDRMAHHTLDVSTDESMEVMAKRIAEFSALFSSKYFNICADETFDLCKGKSKAYGEEKGIRRVYLEFLKKLCSFVQGLGKIPMFWGDVLIEEPELIKEIPGDYMLLNWEYAPEVREDNINRLSAAGITNVFLCPGVQSWNHFINKQHDAYLNISGTCRNARKIDVKGLMVTEWGDLGAIAEPEFSDIGVIYAAAFSWREADCSEEEINKAISKLYYGDRTGTLVSLFSELSGMECIDWWRLVYTMEKETGRIDERITDFGPGGFVSREKQYDKSVILNQIENVAMNANDRAKDIAERYILMAKGDLLFGQMGCFMDGKTTQKPSEKEVREWILLYETNWNKCSKPSELFRLKEIFEWCLSKL